MANNIDLKALFQTVTEQLADKKDNLNEADSYNHNHGDHMVNIFSLIQDAVSQRSDKPLDEQLAFASQVVEEKANSGSGKLYAQGLSSAAKKFSGRSLDQNNLGELVQSLLGAETSQQEPASQTGGPLGSLLSGLTGQSNRAGTDQQFGLDGLMRAGMAFFQSKQDGESNMDAIMDALMSSSPMGKTPHRAQSASIVTSTLMKFVGNLNK